MPIKLSLREKCYIIALFGDIPEHRRKELLAISSMPAQAGPAIMIAGKEFVQIHPLSKVKLPIRRRRTRAMMALFGNE